MDSTKSATPPDSGQAFIAVTSYEVRLAAQAAKSHLLVAETNISEAIAALHGDLDEDSILLGNQTLPEWRAGYAKAANRCASSCIGHATEQLKAIIAGSGEMVARVNVGGLRAIDLDERQVAVVDEVFACLALLGYGDLSPEKKLELWGRAINYVSPDELKEALFRTFDAMPGDPPRAA
jgi:hypothetical protein